MKVTPTIGVNEQAKFLFGTQCHSALAKCGFRAVTFVAAQAVMLAMVFTGCQNNNASGNDMYHQINNDNSSVVTKKVTRFSKPNGSKSNSSVDLIVGAKNQPSLYLKLMPNREDVSLTADTDLGEDGLILDTSNSPTDLTIDGGGRIINLTGKASGEPLITVKSGVTLTLRNITLDGIKDNTAPLIKVETGGKLIMEVGAIIRNNVNKDISEAAELHGGGVIVAGGTFTMNSGQIFNNATSSYLKNSKTDASFTMNGGTISGNKVDGDFSSGGGVGVGKGNTVLKGGTVFDTEEWSYGGGGVHVLNGGTFIMNGGEIAGNEVIVLPKFVAVAGNQIESKPEEGKVAYSLDGDNWTTIKLEGTWWGVAYANDRFIALSTPKDEKDGQIAYSLDGMNWTAVPVEGKWWGAAYGNSQYVAVGDKCVAYSTDGKTWTKESSNNPYRRVVYGNGKFVASTRNQTPGAFCLENRSNGWQQFGTLSSGAWLGLVYADSKFVAVSFDGSKKIAINKDDNKGWNELNFNQNLLDTRGGIAYGKNKFVVVSTKNKTAYSIDGGANWTAPTSQPSGEWNDVTYGNGRFVAVGSDNKIAHSDDGMTWSAPKTVEGQWRKVAYGSK